MCAGGDSSSKKKEKEKMGSEGEGGGGSDQVRRTRRVVLSVAVERLFKDRTYVTRPGVCRSALGKSICSSVVIGSLRVPRVAGALVGG